MKVLLHRVDVDDTRRVVTGILHRPFSFVAKALNALAVFAGNEADAV